LALVYALQEVSTDLEVTRCYSYWVHVIMSDIRVYATLVITDPRILDFVTLSPGPMSSVPINRHALSRK